MGIWRRGLVEPEVEAAAIAGIDADPVRHAFNP
jgi:hypothetical protein